MISARPVTAASGRPPAMPLAVVIRSGTTPSCSQANQSPVRQKPVWISSAMKTTPLRAAPRRQRRQEARGAGTMKPPSPWIGSMRTAATFVRADLLLDHVDRPRRGLRRRPGRRRGTGRTSAPGRPRRRTGRSRACTACSSRSAPSSGWCGRGRRGRTTTTAGRPVACRAILTAFSTASAPELNSAERFSWSPGVSAVERLADRDVRPRTA